MRINRFVRQMCAVVQPCFSICCFEDVRNHSGQTCVRFQNEGFRQIRAKHGMSLAYTIGQTVEIDSIDEEKNVLVIKRGRIVTTDSWSPRRDT